MRAIERRAKAGVTSTSRQSRSRFDQYAEKALGNREYFLNKPYGAGQGRPITPLICV
jgi:hypothetical protein